MKTFDKKDVFSWSNAEEAKMLYLNKRGYFGNTLKQIQENIKNENSYILKGVDTESATYTFLTEHFIDPLFLPISKVKKETKYRPFLNIEEFKKLTYGDFCTQCIGETIQIEHKITSERYSLMIIGTFQNGLVLPLYGELNMKQLFDTFKLYQFDKWQPFGVEE